MNKGRKPVPVTYNGVTYESVYDCAAAFDLNANAVRWRLKRSLPLEPALGFRRMVTYDGRMWSVRELAEHCGVSPRTIARRLRKGGDPTFSGHCGRACEYGGKRDARIAALARELE
ncbi:hypothetical protein ACR73B_16755, partial [Enterococcus innesii]|uniref:hypothetical protein n=1 Tax=Enterococcus innesii TaxID=2839759 RepID=UPI003DA3F131